MRTHTGIARAVGHHVRLPGVDERVAAAIGGDTLQRQSQGRLVPDSFAHGASAQRVRWFSKGIATGQGEQCNTLAGRQL